MKADLHIHSYHSDGKFSPGKIVEYAAKHKLDVISLTDHDTIEGLREARQTARMHPALTLISGVELSTYQNDDELHILGYGIDETCIEMKQLLVQAQENRRKRIGRILACLERFGIHLTMKDIESKCHHSISLGRMHVARLLIQQGHVRTIRDAFDRYLSYETNIIDYSPTDFISAREAISIILHAGGIPVLAHPTIALFDRYIDILIGFGLQGVEVFKGTRTSIEEFYLETVVKDKGLLITGGSDWHGYHSTLNLGNFSVDTEKIRAFLDSVDGM